MGSSRDVIYLARTVAQTVRAFLSNRRGGRMEGWILLIAILGALWLMFRD